MVQPLRSFSHYRDNHTSKKMPHVISYVIVLSCFMIFVFNSESHSEYGQNYRGTETANIRESEDKVISYDNGKKAVMIVKRSTHSKAYEDTTITWGVYINIIIQNGIVIYSKSNLILTLIILRRNSRKTVMYSHLSTRISDQLSYTFHKPLSGIILSPIIPYHANTWNVSVNVYHLFGINITFSRCQITYTEACAFGAMIVEAPDAPTDVETLQYCGYVPPWSSVYNVSRLSIILKITHFITTVNIEFFYQVVNRNVLFLNEETTKYKLKKSYLGYVAVSTYQLSPSLIGPNKWVFKVLVQAGLGYTIHMISRFYCRLSSRCSMHTYDGYNNMFPLLFKDVAKSMLRKHEANSSSLHIFVTGWATGYKRALYASLLFSSIYVDYNTNIHVVWDKPTLIQLTLYNTSFYRIWKVQLTNKVKRDSYHQLNIIKFNPEGFTGVDCDYGGLFITDKWRNFGPYCSQAFRNTTVHFWGAEVTVILYGYSTSFHISGEIAFSLSKCLSLSNPCHYIRNIDYFRDSNYIKYDINNYKLFWFEKKHILTAGFTHQNFSMCMIFNWVETSSYPGSTNCSVGIGLRVSPKTVEEPLFVEQLPKLTSFSIFYNPKYLSQYICHGVLIVRTLTGVLRWILDPTKGNKKYHFINTHIHLHLITNCSWIHSSITVTAHTLTYYPHTMPSSPLSLSYVTQKQFNIIMLQSAKLTIPLSPESPSSALTLGRRRPKGSHYFSLWTKSSCHFGLKNGTLNLSVGKKRRGHPGIVTFFKLKKFMHWKSPSAVQYVRISFSHLYITNTSCNVLLVYCQQQYMASVEKKYNHFQLNHILPAEKDSAHSDIHCSILACYQFINEMPKGLLSTWENAQMICQRNNGHLWTISSHEEWIFVRNIMLENYENFFFSTVIFLGFNLNVVISNDTGNVHGGFYFNWVDGTTVVVSNFHTSIKHFPVKRLMNHIGVFSSLQLQHQLEQHGKMSVDGTSNFPCYAAVPFSAHFESWVWVSIPCESEFKHEPFVCEYQLPTNKSFMNISLTSHHVCSSGWTYVDGKCLRIITHALHQNNSDCPRVASISSVVSPALRMFLSRWSKFWMAEHPIGHFDSSRVTEFNLDSILVTSDNDTLCTYLYPKLSFCPKTSRDEFPQWQIIHESCTKWPNQNVGVLCEDALATVRHTCSPGHFLCADGSCILNLYHCDGVNNCVDNSDEIDCEVSCINADNRMYCTPCSGMLFLCLSGDCIRYSHTCDGTSHCLDSSDEIFCPDELITHTYEDIPHRSNNKEAGDCHSNEFCLLDPLVDDSSLKCQPQYHMFFCGRHECPGMFKCSRSYCVPHYAVCDGTKHCPHGEDEVGCGALLCAGMLRCHRDNVCVHPQHVCDGKVHCGKSHDDEQLCDVIPCPQNCECLGYAVKCDNTKLNNIPTFNENVKVIIYTRNNLHIRTLSFQKLNKLTKLDISYNNIDFIGDNTFCNLYNLIDLDLSYNKLSILSSGTFFRLRHVIHLKLTGNPISVIKAHTFHDMEHLTNLSLNYMRVETIEDFAFSGHHYIEYLNLHSSNLHKVEINTFNGLKNIKYLDLTDNPLLEVNTLAFSTFPELYTLTSNREGICCAVHYATNCTPRISDVISTCDDLLPCAVLKIFVWVFGITACLGNLGACVWYIKQLGCSSNALMFLNLSLADLLMGVYLVIIGIKDVNYSGMYGVYASIWKTSILCQIAGILAFVSIEGSSLVLLFVYVNRLLLVLYPFSFLKRNMFVKYLMLLGWILAGVLSISVVVLGTTHNGVCLFYDHSRPDITTSTYPLLAICVVNVGILLIIAITSTILRININKSRKECGRKQTRQDKHMLLRLSMVILTNACCLLPSSILILMQLGGVIINTKLTVWLAILILPINASINPVLHTFTTIKFRQSWKM